jgi:hypothetical protein
VSISEPLPLAHLARIESVPGVQGVGFYNFFAGYYQEPKNQISAGAVDIERMKILFPEIDIPQAGYDAMHTTRNAALIGKDLAEARGWKVGDQIPLRSNVWMRKDGAPEWLFEIVGIYQFADGKIPTNELWMNYGYFDEARTFGNGTVALTLTGAVIAPFVVFLLASGDVVHTAIGLNLLLVTGAMIYILIICSKQFAAMVNGEVETRRLSQENFRLGESSILSIDGRKLMLASNENEPASATA